MSDLIHADILLASTVEKALAAKQSINYKGTHYTVRGELISGKAVTRGRRGGLMVSALDSEASGQSSSPDRGHCVVFLSKTFYSHSASRHPGV